MIFVSDTFKYYSYLLVTLYLVKVIQGHEVKMINTVIRRCNTCL